MSVQQIADLLSQAEHDSVLAQPGAPASLLALAVECEGSKFHNPRPLVVREVDLASIFASAKDRREQDLVYLCATCHDNISVYLAVLDSYNGQTPQAVRRSFGNLTRDLGDRAWSHYGGDHHA